MLSAQNIRPTPPDALAGFEHVKRYWDPKRKVHVAKILPGEFYVSNQHEVIATVLGSCISVCVRDPVLQMGGMNHFMLPQQGSHNSVTWDGSQISSETRYGNWAMEYLINELLKAGALKSRLEIKVFGGGQVLSNMTNVGARNIHFIESYLENEGLAVTSKDVGGIHPRKVLYFSDTGKVLVKRIRKVSNETIISREERYRKTLEGQSDSAGSIELFD